MRLIFVFLVGLLVGCVSAPATQVQIVAAPGGPSLAASLTSKTVALVAYVQSEGANDTETKVYCSGVWISQSRIVTANHCVDDLDVTGAAMYAVKYDVYPPGSLKALHWFPGRAAKLIRVDEEHDIALLEALSPPPHETAVLSSEPLLPGTRAYAMGHSIGMWWSWSSGDIAALREIEGGQDKPMVWIQATTPISPGNSGCGLFDEYGDLLGIASRAYGGRAQLINLFVPRQYVDALIRKT